MYPSISHLLNDLFGLNIPLPIQTFGFFVAMGFLVAASILAREMARKEEEGLLDAQTKQVQVGGPAPLSELIINGLIGFILGFKGVYAALNYGELVNDPQGVILSGKGNIIMGLVGAALLVYLKKREFDKNKLEKPRTETITVHAAENVGNMTMMAAFFGILGAKIFHLLENPHEFASLFSSADNFFSGLTMYGGLVVGGAALLYYAKKQQLKLLPVMDSAAPALMISYGVGRMGCHLSGDGDWGIDNLAPKPDWMSFLPDWMWAYTYPHNVINAGVPIEGCELQKYCYELANPVYPTAFYEIVASVLLFGLLWGIRKKIKIPGMLFGIYLICNGFERFWIEKIRINSEYIIFGTPITQAEIISTFLMLLGLSMVLFLKKNPEYWKKW